MVDTRTHALTNTRPCRSTLMTHKPTRTQILRLSVMCADTAQCIQRRRGKWDLLTLVFCVYFFTVFVSLFLSFPCLPHWHCHPQPIACKSVKALCYIHTRTRITHDTISPQEKPWARTGRKTLENQDTIWHLWSLNDFLLGVGLRPTGISQKTGRENYIRENVYAAHSAPSLFAPQMSDYSSTLNLWKGVGGWGGGEKEILSIISLWKGWLLA